MLDLQQLYFDNSICTIEKVIEEVGYERNIVIEAPIIPAKKTNLEIKGNFLSNTDSLLLQTAKFMDYILVSDDQKLIKTANKNDVHALDTPHFLHMLLIENKWSEEKAMNVLNRLKSIYNRIYVVDKVIKDIKNWR